MLVQVWTASSVQCPHEWPKPPNTRPRPSTASRDSESFLGVQPVDQKSLIQRGGTTERRLLWTRIYLVPQSKHHMFGSLPLS
ncbi:hypothetical protein I7I48_08812 [Histoplasma ohiense]|nr:hypothetical protein I7I48_08812 [Histoplasma ohiense (nom. inval.)]